MNCLMVELFKLIIRKDIKQQKSFFSLNSWAHLLTA